MSAEDILKDSSLVAIIAGVIGLLIVLGGHTLTWIGVMLLGIIAVFFGLTNYLRNNKDILALIAAIIGVIVIIVAILHYLKYV